ncbi:MAG: peroxiredoxin family protein [Gammaproteobacteria bacterium]|nr:peroxiredoxin family protein [Gammaproteobacteria bacterium]MDH4254801.1 peroxiredoxin family protein [Gammaproteobacteria bacterium]MDH5310797.1 peroxiredoxin family protein [Gammaproteobacteria bacterium]
MDPMILTGLLGTAALLALVVWSVRKKIGARRAPDILRPGNPLPRFHALDEDGKPVDSESLKGRPAVILFVRGNWCPFCSRQVADLTNYYKAINESGAHLILVTPKPLQTTRRVAHFFDVEFEFWLDESLEIARRFGLLLERGVPADHRADYGEDTLWPASLVVDANGIIRYTEFSRLIADRPNPEKFLRVLRSL